MKVCNNKRALTAFFINLLVIVPSEIYGAKKTVTKAKSSRLSSAVTLPEPHGSCSVRGNVTDIFNQNIARLANYFRTEMEKELQQLSDRVLDALKEQISCFTKREVQIREGSTCKKPSTQAPRATKVHEEEEEEESPTVCVSSNCLDISAKMLDLIDHSAEPCEDFYQYACGGIEKDVHLYPETLLYDVDRRLEEKLETLNPANPIMGQGKIFFDACKGWRKRKIEQEALAFAKKVVQDVGWFAPLGYLVDASLETIPSTSNLTFMLATFMRSHFTPFFDVTVEPNPSNPKSFRLRIGLPQDHFDLSERIDHVTCIEDLRASVRKARRETGETLDLNASYDDYRKCQQKKGLDARLLRIEKAVTSMKLLDHVVLPEHRNNLIQKIKRGAEHLLTHISTMMPSKAKVKKAYMEKEYQVNKIKDLATIIGDQVNWEEFFFILIDKRLDPEEELHVYNQKEISEIMTILGNEWTTNSSELHNDLLMLWSEFVYSNLVSPLNPSENYCLQAIKYFLPDISSSLYLHSFPDVQLTRLQNYLTSKIESVKSNFRSLIQGSEDQLEMIFKKVDSAEVNIGGFFDASSRNSSLMEGIKGMSLNKSHDRNLDFLLKRYRQLLYGLLDESTNSPRAMWLNGIVPFSKKGFYVPETNTIYLPVATLQPPNLYYRKGLPDYIFYAGLGNLIAEQFVHILDGTGVKFNGNEKANLDVPPNLIISSECLSDQLSSSFELEDNNVRAKYAISPLNFKLNDLLASSGAIHLSWLTYLNSISDLSDHKINLIDSPEEHLIWLGKTPLKPIRAYYLRVAQIQCSANSQFDLIDIMENPSITPRQRVNVMLKNDKLFSEAFQCSEKSSMNQAYKCPFLGARSAFGSGVPDH